MTGYSSLIGIGEELSTNRHVRAVFSSLTHCNKRGQWDRKRRAIRYRAAATGKELLLVCRPLAQNASFLAFHSANLDSWLLAQHLVSVLRRTGSADSAER